jgi:RimJ/RimL family protein N-acetyltransferase
MPQPTFHTERLSLVPLAEEHLDWEVELDSDPEVMRYLSGRASGRDEVEASHARRMAAAERVDGLGFWLGLLGDEFVGWWALQPAHGPDQPDDAGVADLGYRLLRRHWRKGLASEGARELVRYGFDDVGLDRIIAQTLSINVNSRGVMERAGLTYVRTFPTSVKSPVEGPEHGEVEYEMTREQYRAAAAGCIA